MGAMPFPLWGYTVWPGHIFVPVKFANIPLYAEENSEWNIKNRRLRRRSPFWKNSKKRLPKPAPTMDSQTATIVGVRHRVGPVAA